MPKGVSEISQGNQFSRSANEGQLADAATRTFRIILNSPSEVFDIQSTCGVFVGDAHPTNTNIACVSFDAKYDGDSRTVLVATFNYASEAAAQDFGGGGSNPKTISPENRPANWTISTELSEVPVRRTRRELFDIFLDPPVWGTWGKPTNPAGDLYEGLTRLEPMTTIKVTQFKLGGTDDPTADSKYVGYINDRDMQIGSRRLKTHTVMFRAFNATPAVESWGSLIKRGWSCEYTFLVRNQILEYDAGAAPGLVFGFEGDGTPLLADIGWDAAVIVEGRNVICFDPAAAGAPPFRDPFGQPLKVGEDKVPLIPANPELATGLAAGDRARACVSISGFSDRGVSQSPAAEPIALNFDGTPRKIEPGVYEPFVERHQIYEDVDLVGVLKLRLY